MTLEQIKKTAAFIKKEIEQNSPLGDGGFSAGIILGTGLGGLVKEIEILHTIPYDKIPNMPVSTVEGHSGKLIFGTLGGKNVAVMQGRFHFYEGYTMQQIAFPIRVMKELGIKSLFVSNAAGGMNPDFSIGELMIIRDHINFFGTNPLIGKNSAELGPRFPDMSETYDKKMIAQALNIAKKNKIKVETGVYAGLSGPCFETPAEYKMLRIIGADAVGMSTVPEVITARHMGLRCFAMSIITDLGIENKIVEITHEDIVREAGIAEPKLTLIFKELIGRME